MSAIATRWPWMCPSWEQFCLTGSISWTPPKNIEIHTFLSKKAIIRNKEHVRTHCKFSFTLVIFLMQRLIILSLADCQCGTAKLCETIWHMTSETIWLKFMKSHFPPKSFKCSPKLVSFWSVICSTEPSGVHYMLVVCHPAMPVTFHETSNFKLSEKKNNLQQPSSSEPSPQSRTWSHFWSMLMQLLSSLHWNSLSLQALPIVT